MYKQTCGLAAQRNSFRADRLGPRPAAAGPLASRTAATTAEGRRKHSSEEPPTAATARRLLPQQQQPPPPAAAAAAASSPRSSSLLLPCSGAAVEVVGVTTVGPAGQAARILPSPKATRPCGARTCIQTDSGGGRCSHGSPVQQWEVRRRGPEPRSVRIQSRLRLRPAMRPTARTRSWLAHCSEQSGGRSPQRSKAARRHEAPNEPRPTVSRRCPVRPPGPEARARRGDSHSANRHGRQ